MDLVNWRYTQTNITSCAAIDTLATDVLLQPAFSTEHVIGLNMKRELKILDEYGNTGSPFSAHDGWREASVKIKLPKESFAHDSEDSAPEIEVTGVQYRPILEVLKAVYQDPQAAEFHFTPFKMFWQADAPAGEEPPPPERIPDTIQDVYTLIYGIAATAAVLTFCKRELFQAIWLLLLDDDFLHAYVHGFVILCGDGIRRRMFPRFLTYSADYPEKILIACIRFLARCPCPICLVTKDKIENMGTKSDMRQREKWQRLDTGALREKLRMTRRWIFERGFSLLSKHVGNVLDNESLMPKQSAFSQKLGHLGFNHFALLVPDLMHEFELGVWKAVFIHLMRILHAAGEDKIQEFNRRFRQVPPFGRSTIRRFSNNVSSMKKLAARDFEDMLQVFSSLPMTTKLSWTCCMNWYHGTPMRNCVYIQTPPCGHSSRQQQLSEAARGQRKAREAQKGKKPQSAKSKGKQKSRGAVRKEFNLCTAKLHALGHYLSAIVKFGTTDNYTTQIGELEHRIVKRYYARTNKNKFARQIAKEQRRAALIRAIMRRARAARVALQESECKETDKTGAEQAAWEERAAAAVEDLRVMRVSPRVHYHVSKKARSCDMLRWVSEHKGDAAVKDFIPKLTDHILTRLSKQEFDGEEPTYSSEERQRVQFVRNKLYLHKKLQINYTTYDMRRGQDSINPRTRSDIMLLAHEDDEAADDYPFWYARVVGVFHVNVVHELRPRQWSEEEQIDFLLVRWYGRDLTIGGGFHNRRLPCVSFLSGDEEGAFSFLDPGIVMRAAHLIPAFAYGRTIELMGPSMARRVDENDEDWDHYYVNIFGDRDLFMHHRGGGVGHKGHVGYATSRDAVANADKEDEEDVEEPWHKSDHEDDTYEQEDEDTHDADEEKEEDGPEEGEDDYDYD
ncbi:hypothetical protein CERSUDRAFT_134414, partial [Gelatoporia subvermispora B]